MVRDNGWLMKVNEGWLMNGYFRNLLVDLNNVCSKL